MITVAVVFCALFGWRCLALGEYGVGCGAVAAAVVLAVYLRWFWLKKSRPASGRPADQDEA